MLCLLCPDTNIGKKKRTFYCVLVVVPFTEQYVTCNIMILLKGEDLKGEHFCITVRATNNIEDFLNMDTVSCI